MVYYSAPESRESHYVTIDSFPMDVPSNWEEIADYLNARIDELYDKAEAEAEDDYLSADEYRWLDHSIDKLWLDYCNGDLPDAPKEIYCDD